MVSTQSDNNQCSGGSSWRQPRIIIISDLGLIIDCLVHCQLILIIIIRSALKHNFEYSWKHFYYHVTNFLSQATALLGSVAQGSHSNVLHCLRWFGKAMGQESCSPVKPRIVKPRIVKPRLPLSLLRIPGAGDPLVLSEFDLKMFFSSAFHLVVSYSS